MYALNLIPRKRDAGWLSPFSLITIQNLQKAIHGELELCSFDGLANILIAVGEMILKSD